MIEVSAETGLWWRLFVNEPDPRVLPTYVDVLLERANQGS